MPAAVASCPTLSLVVSTARTLGPCRAERSSPLPSAPQKAGGSVAAGCGQRQRARRLLCQAPAVNGYGRPPAASWVMGRSARWHTTDGVAMLAEDGVAEDARRDLNSLRWITAAALKDPSGAGLALWLLDRVVWIVWRSFRRTDD